MIWCHLQPWLVVAVLYYWTFEMWSDSYSYWMNISAMWAVLCLTNVLHSWIVHHHSLNSAIEYINWICYILFRHPGRHRRCIGNDPRKVSRKSLSRCDSGTSVLRASCAHIPTDPRKPAAAIGGGSHQWCHLVKSDISFTLLPSAAYASIISCTQSVECMHEHVLQQTLGTSTSNANTR